MKPQTWEWYTVVWSFLWDDTYQLTWSHLLISRFASWQPLHRATPWCKRPVPMTSKVKKPSIFVECAACIMIPKVLPYANWGQYQLYYVCFVGRNEYMTFMTLTYRVFQALSSCKLSQLIGWSFCTKPRACNHLS